MPAAGADAPGWTIEPLSRRHDRAAFDCGEPVLDEFLRRYARQNQDKGLSRTWVAVRAGSAAPGGYYALSTGSVRFEHLPEEDRKRLPRHPVPVIHLGRLAVDRSCHGQGLGSLLLVDALRRSLAASEAVGAWAVEVVAKGEESRAFYERFGFRPLVEDRLHLYLPMATVRRALGAEGQNS